jgi:hypothetical protein
MGLLGACRLGLDLGALGGALAETGKEEGLVDPTVEDRDAQLNALDDYIPALHAGFTRELAGRQVIGHRSYSSFAVHYMSPSMPIVPDGLNAFCRFLGALRGKATPLDHASNKR